MKKSTKEWFDSAGSDLLLIKEICLNENLTHLSAFHARQAAEKAFKAIIEEFDPGFIKTHALETLYNTVKDRIQLKFDYDLLIILGSFYIDSRYPGEMGLLPNGKPTLKESKQFFNFAREIVEAAKTACRH
jgi:HEPN domain-containing protein